MELSDVVTQYGSSLTRAERNLLGQLATGMSVAEEDRYAQKIKDLAAARDVINQLPDAKTAKRQSNVAKAAILKDRLKMLRQMIPFMSASAAKSLKAELKQIAVQLASLQSESSGSSSAVAASQTTTAETPLSGSDAVAAPDTVSTDETTSKQDDSSPVVQGVEVKRGESASEDRQLKESIEELKNLLKAVMATAKRKQQSVRGAGQLRSYAVAPDSVGSVTITV